MEKYKKVVNACELIIKEIEKGNIDAGYWNIGNVMANDIIITTLRNHAKELLRVAQLQRTQKFINQLLKKYGNSKL